MRIKSLIFCSCIIVSLLYPGKSFSKDGNRRESATLSIISNDSVKHQVTVTKRVQPIKRDESIYKIDIKEDRSYDYFFSKKILSGYTNKNLRSLLISWNRFLPKPLNSFYTTIIESAFRFPFIFYFFAIILLLIGNVIVVITILFLTNSIMNYRVKRRRKLKNIFEKILTDLMLQVNDIPETISILSRPNLKSYYNLLIEVLAEFQKSFRGDSDRQIIELYNAMDLGRISYNKTFAISLYKQAEGIRELANMHPEYAIEMIASRLNDKDDVIRTEAQICYPYVNRESPFDFLDILEKPFSQWAQLNIYYFIKLHEMPVPSFDRWLNSRHTNVVNFCILMITLFQQQENAEQIQFLLQAPNERTRNLAIKACGDLALLESKTILKELFRSENLNNQLEITKSFQSIGDDADIPFLEEIVRSENISLRLEACRTLHFLSKIGRNHLENLNESMNLVLTSCIAHIKDPRN